MTIAAEMPAPILAGLEHLFQAIRDAGDPEAIDKVASRVKARDLIRPVIVTRDGASSYVYLPAPALLRHLAKTIEEL